MNKKEKIIKIIISHIPSILSCIVIGIIIVGIGSMFLLSRDIVIDGYNWFYILLPIAVNCINFLSILGQISDLK